MAGAGRGRRRRGWGTRPWRPRVAAGHWAALPSGVRPGECWLGRPGRHGPAVVVVARSRVVVVDPSLAATVVAGARATVVDTGDRTVVTVVEVATGFSPSAGVDT